MPAHKTKMSHYEQSLERDLERLRSKLTEMGMRTERSLRDGLTALVENDRQLAYSIIVRDAFIDDLDREIDRLCLEFLVRQQPAAIHLRFAAAAIKINMELERVGDYAKSVAREVLKLSQLGALPVNTESLVDLANRSVPMFRAALQGFVNRDSALADATIAIEEEVDDQRAKINEELFAARQSGEISMEAYNSLITIVRRFDRIADQARNICLETHYMVTGQYAKHGKGLILRVLFVDATNSSSSQMAEAIGQELNDPHFLFSSAGVTPMPIEPKVLEFLKGKGHEMAHAKSKSPDQVPNFNYHQFFVALSPRARAVLPAQNARTVNLEWLVEDPSDLEGTYQYLKTHISDLVQAVLGEKVKALR